MASKIETIFAAVRSRLRSSSASEISAGSSSSSSSSSALQRGAKSAGASGSVCFGTKRFAKRAAR